MKTICVFCKTEFNVSQSGKGKCPICGHRTLATRRVSSTQKLWMAVSLFFAASLFAVISMKVFNKNQKEENLIVSIYDVKYTDTGYIVRGNIRNFSDTTYSVPDMIFTLKSDSGVILNQIVKLPPSGLIDPKSDLEFASTLEPKVIGAGKISVEFVGDNNDN